MANKILKIFARHKILLLVFAVCAFIPYKTNAATLFISPASTEVSIGNITTMKVYVDTLGKSINNAEAVIQFPTDMLDVVSITKGSSVFSLWTEEPNFSNSTGRITFNGGIPNPGFTGRSGYVVSITFKAKKQGTASILFTDGAVRENDGLGTDILTDKKGSVIQIIAPVVKEEIKIPEKTPVKIPEKIPEKTPVVKEEIKTPVKVESENIAPMATFNPSIRFDGVKGIVKLSDENFISDIDYYTLTIDNASNFKIKKEELINFEYYLPILNEGSHIINIVSFDKSGKYTESTFSFISPAISAPVLSLNSSIITTGDSVIISGKTGYPNSKVNVVLELDGKEIKKYSQTTGADGSFSVTTDTIKNTGLVNIWAESILSDTVKSMPSEKVYLKVNEITAIKITFYIFYPLLWIIAIFAIMSLLIMLLYLGWHKFFGLRKKINDESRETAIGIHKAMSLLKNELGDQLESLERIKADRNLNKKEKEIFSEIEKNIDVVDSFIEKKLKKLM